MFEARRLNKVYVEKMSGFIETCLSSRLPLQKLKVGFN
jgi:hypothetical protein